MHRQFSQILTFLFSLIWIAVIFLDYWYYHQTLIYTSIVDFQYVEFILFLLVLGGGIFALKKFINVEKGHLFWINGLSVSLLLLLFCTVVIFMQLTKTNLPFTFTSRDVLIYVGTIFGVILVTYLISAVCFVIGDSLFDKLFSISFSILDNLLIRTALGIVLLCMLLFLLGAVNALYQIVVGGILILFLGIFYKRLWNFIQFTLLRPLKNLRQLNILGIASFLLIMTFISLLYLQNVTSYPVGFDSLAIYLNVPNLISQRGGLIEGYSPYYWSLFASIGHILFDSLSVVISLSNLGGILAGISIYAICRKWIDLNYALLAVALFFSLPMINFQFYRDVKTDLGLLFFMLVVVLLLTNYLKYLFPDSFSQVKEVLKVSSKSKYKRLRTKKRESKIPKPKKELTFKANPNAWLSSKFSVEYQYFILMGIMSGMMLGIKLTGLILIFSLIGVLVYLQTEMLGYLIATILLVFIILIGGLDVASGLRAYHFSASLMTWLTLLVGGIGIVYLWIKQKSSFLRTIRHIAIYSLFVIVVYLPWPIKNFVESGSISLSTLIEGKQTGPSKSVKEFIQNANN